MSDLRSELNEQMQAICDKHGHLTPEIVVEAARPADHPLHPRVFDRSIKEAAETYYRERAHDLIRSCRVQYREPDEQSDGTIRRFHATRKENGYVYEPIEKIANDPFSRELLRRDMEREWKQLLTRYQEYEAFLTMVKSDVKKAKPKVKAA